MAGQRRFRGKFIEIDLDGPVFEPTVRRTVKGAIGDGLAELGIEGARTMQAHIRAGPFVRSGATVRSTAVEIHRSRPGAIGWVKVYPDDMYPNPKRPTRTWMEEGKRRGVALRPALYVFRKTARKLNTLKYDFIANLIARRLNG